MKVILFGATGMVGQGALRECLHDPDVQRVLTVGRVASGQQDPKLEELVHRDFTDFSSMERKLAGYDACFFCLGISSLGMTEPDYTRITYDFAMSAASALVKGNPGMTFIYVSGAGTDSSEQSRTVWARVKGKTENALLGLPFKAAYMFRPAFIQPLRGVRSKTPVYRLGYAVLGPLFPVLRRLFPKHVTTTEEVGRAMLRVAKSGASKQILENEDIVQLAEAPGRSS